MTGPRGAVDRGSRRDRTDLGNAYRLIDRHGHELRYVHVWKRWVVWDGRRWVPDKTGEIDRRAIETVEALWEERDVAQSEADRTAASRHATASQASARLTAMVRQAQALAAADHTAFDADPWRLNVANGLLDLRTGSLHPHDPAAMCTKLADVVYDPAARCPTWEGFLAEVLVDGEVIDYIQRLVGYALTGVVRDHVLPVLVGDGNNGKSTLLATLLAMMGSYGGTAPSELLVSPSGAEHPTIYATLHGRRLVVVTETDQDGRLHDRQVKKLTGGEPVDVRRMREDYWSFEPTHTLMLATNHFPKVRGHDYGIRRRLKPIRFPVVIAECDVDPELPARLRAELSGILAWAVRGCRRWQENGCKLTTPASVGDGLAFYLEATDLLSPFISRYCVIAEGHHAYAADLFAAYQEWCQKTGAGPLTQRAFGLQLSARGLVNKKHGKKRQSAWFGIGLVERDQDSGDET